MSKIRPFIFFCVEINCVNIADFQGPVSMKPEIRHRNALETIMDLAATVLSSKGKAEWRGGLLHCLRMARHDITMSGRIESLSSLNEIAAWVNEGGAGDEVCR